MGLERKSFCSQLAILVDPSGSFCNLELFWGGVVLILSGSFGVYIFAIPLSQNV